MVIVDDQTGVFLFTRERKAGQGTVVLQLWSPVDYWSSGWEEITPAESEGEENSVVVIAGWVVDDQGEEREIEFNSPDYSDDPSLQDEAIGLDRGWDGWPGGAGLTLLEDFPDETPVAIRQAITQREERRLAVWRKMANTLNDAEGRNVWLRLVGGDAVGGRLESIFEESIVLEKPRNLRYPGTKAPSMLYANRIVAAREFAGKRIPKRVFGPEFGGWMRETDSATIEPQLWQALCPNCVVAVRPPWRSEECQQCRSGNTRDEYSRMPTTNLDVLLRDRVERKGLELVVEPTQGDRWIAALRTPGGEAGRQLADG